MNGEKMYTMKDVKISGFQPYVAVGRWVLPCGLTRLPARKKPNWFHRKAMQILIGWKWEEVK